MNGYDILVIGAGPGGGPPIGAVALGATSQQLASVIFPHPTLSEALHEAVLAARDGAIHA